MWTFMRADLLNFKSFRGRHLINLASKLALAIADLALWADGRLKAMRPALPRKRRPF